MGRYSLLAPRRARHWHGQRDACPRVWPESFRSTLEAACAAVDRAPAYAIAPASSSGYRSSQAVSHIRSGPLPPSRRSSRGPRQRPAAELSRQLHDCARTARRLRCFLRRLAICLPKRHMSFLHLREVGVHFGDFRIRLALCHRADTRRRYPSRPASFPYSVRHQLVAPIFFSSKRGERGAWRENPFRCQSFRTRLLTRRAE